jgi:hypothetical protein
MQRLTSYRVSRGPDGSRGTYTNWYEEAGHIAFIDNQVRFYNAVGFVNSHYKVYIPQQGEHLEITGEPSGEDEEWAKFQELVRRLL